MNTSYSMDAYRAHDLSISMKTSSGDTISMDFANHKSASMQHKENQNGSQSSMSFSSMQSFEFKVETNGIDAQDQKEIDAFMKQAQPFIDDFLKELQEDAPKSPVTQLAQTIAGIFEPNRDRNENQKNHVKSNIVEMFDNSMQKLKHPPKDEKVDKPEALDMEKLMDKIFKDAQKLLEKTLKEFDQVNKSLYA